MPAFCRLQAGAEGQMRTAVQHHMAHFLPGAVPMGEVYGVMVKKLDAVFVQLLGYGSDVIVQQRKYRQEIPAEMSAEEHRRRYTGFCEAFCPGLDFVQIVGIRPVEVRPMDPPCGHSFVAFVQRNRSFLQEMVVSDTSIRIWLRIFNHQLVDNQGKFKERLIFAPAAPFRIPSPRMPIENKKPPRLRRLFLFCVRTTKKIFLPFLRMNSNSHRNSNHPQSGYLYFFTIHYYLLPNRQVSKDKSEK